MSDDFSYIGSELELFQHATIWKSYFRLMVAPYLGEEVLEVGAGLGGTTRVLCRKTHQRWVCLEPDSRLLDQVHVQLREGELPSFCQPLEGTTDDLLGGDAFDSVLYMDVLEHIEDDQGEMERAAQLLKPGGKVVVLAPAHQYLFTPFDEAIGHFRRYNKASMRRAAATSPLREVKMWYLDSVGVLASSANRFMLNASMPTASQIRLWDKVMVPLSRVLDPIFDYRLGKSVLGIWERV